MQKVHRPFFFFRKDPVIFIVLLLQSRCICSVFTPVSCFGLGFILVSFLHHDGNTFASDNHCGLFIMVLK